MLTLPELTLQHITTERYNMDTTQLKRIADAMEEILRLVKADQEQYKKKSEEEDDDQGNTAIITEERMNEKN